MNDSMEGLSGAGTGVWCFGYLRGAVDELLAAVDSQDMPVELQSAVARLRRARQRTAEVWEQR